MVVSGDYPFGSRQWLIHADIWARYLLYLPGSLLSSAGLVLSATLLRKMELPSIARDARIAAIAFLLNGVVAGLVVPPGQQVPTSPFNYDTFAATFGLPVQMFRALSAVAIAYFVLRMLRVFRIQAARQLEEAHRRQLQAQQEALEQQERARGAALEERERIAREMHDGLAQVLGFLGFKTRVIQQLVANGHREQAERELEQAHKTLQESYDEVRQAILSLRTATELGEGLAPALRKTAVDFREQNSISVELSLPEEGELEVPPGAAVQLVRIVQEALANVRKHSRATRVWLRLERRNGETLLTVEDDGIGFDPSEVAGKSRRSFGLATMRERAESIGARFEVAAIPGEGTRIQVRFPLEQHTTEGRLGNSHPLG
jgi:signal transduction histidine kinase